MWIKVHCIVLYYIVLYGMTMVLRCIVLYCIIFSIVWFDYGIVLYYSVLYCIILYFIVWYEYDIVLYWTFYLPFTIIKRRSRYWQFIWLFFSLLNISKRCMNSFKVSDHSNFFSSGSGLSVQWWCYKERYWKMGEKLRNWQC